MEHENFGFLAKLTTLQETQSIYDSLKEGLHVNFARDMKYQDSIDIPKIEFIKCIPRMYTSYF